MILPLQQWQLQQRWPEVVVTEETTAAVELEPPSASEEENHQEASVVDDLPRINDEKDETDSVNNDDAVVNHGQNP